MCDYSLMNFPNRLAVQGEELVVYRFSSGSLGLASPADLNCNSYDASSERGSFWARVKDFFASPAECPIPAVCVPPGARLTLQGIAGGLRRKHGLQCEEEVVFDQLTADPNVHRDAIVFSNGTTLKLQELPEGQRVTVIALTPSAHEEPTIAEFTAERLAW